MNIHSFYRFKMQVKSSHINFHIVSTSVLLSFVTHLVYPLLDRLDVLGELLFAAGLPIELSATLRYVQYNKTLPETLRLIVPPGASRIVAEKFCSCIAPITCFTHSTLWPLHLLAFTTSCHLTASSATIILENSSSTLMVPVSTMVSSLLPPAAALSTALLHIQMVFPSGMVVYASA